jgi:hypothetical protein
LPQNNDVRGNEALRQFLLGALIILSANSFAGSCLNIKDFESVIDSNNSLVYVKVINIESPFVVFVNVLEVIKGSGIPETIKLNSVPMQFTSISGSNMKEGSEYIVSLNKWEQGYQMPTCGQNAALVEGSNLYLRDLNLRDSVSFYFYMSYSNFVSNYGL